MIKKVETILPGQINTPVKSKEAEARQIRADVMDFVANGGEIYYAKPNERGIKEERLTKQQRNKIMQYTGD